MIARRIALYLWVAALLTPLAMNQPVSAQEGQAELHFSADTNTERDSGVWIDGKYAGYLKELKGSRTVMLPPGEHEVSVRQAGYKDFTTKFTVRPGDVKEIAVSLAPDPSFHFPKDNAAELRLDVKPNRAAVYVDGGYLGHASDFGGRFHSMLLIPGKHQLRIELKGYQTYEKEITVAAGEKTRMQAELAPAP